MAAVLRVLQTAIAIFRDFVENDGKTLAYTAIGIISVFFALLVLIIMPVVIHERVPVAITEEQAVWYWQGAKDITEMTQSPCDEGVYVDWQEVIAIDAVRLKQNFKKSSAGRARDLAADFVEPDGECAYCTGKDEDRECTTYTTYSLNSIQQVMNEIGMSEEAQKTVREKYLAIRYDFLIGYRSEPSIVNYDSLYSGGMVWPVPSYHRVSSPYGIRVHPVKKGRSMHYGIDIPAPVGTLIHSPADGKVKSYSWSDGAGWVMVVDHGENTRGERITTRYCHLSEKVARVGQEVKAGDSIAKVGNTGRLTTGPHLHFEIYVNGVTVDPVTLFASVK
ncbi:MAG: M23 family metallopeptidase [Syntrophomonadaceae bacterium]|nr:M23 family metallopeptidase [Syntrophomonadaceae bacterium]